MTFTPESFGIFAFAIVALLLFGSLGSRLSGLQRQVAMLSRIEAKVDLLLKQANIKFDPYATVQSDIIDALRQNQKINAIKLYRQSSGVGLKEAKEHIEEVQRRSGMR